MDVPALVEEELAEVEVAAFAGGPVELDEGEFDLLVAGDVVDFPGPKRQSMRSA